MRIQILDDAEQDLIDGFRFYEAQVQGLGDYFLDSLSSDIDSLHIYAGIHSKFFVIFASFRIAFLSPYITAYQVRLSEFMPCWTVARIQKQLKTD